jgi:hypothetical protein
VGEDRFRRWWAVEAFVSAQFSTAQKEASHASR